MPGALDRPLGLHGLIVYLIVGPLVVAEGMSFVGFVLPGETPPSSAG